ncbi:type I CRISPR-associated protein Cas7 [Clostridium perfringens]
MKKNMVYMLIGIRVRMAMWNASFSKYAKQNSMGEEYGSPQALGFAIKEQLHRDGYNILYRKQVNDKGVMDLKAVFESKIGSVNKALKTEKDVKEILFKKFTDIVNFGTTFTAKGYPSFGVTGAVQIGVAQNKFKGTETIVNDMLPCFSAENAKKKKDEKDDEKLTSNTLGEQILLDKAHFLYDVTLNPFQYKDLVKELDDFNGYTEEDYNVFKKASMRAVSNLNSKSKKGCTNEFAMYVETNDDVKDTIDLNCLGEYVEVYEKDGKTVYDLRELASLLYDVKNSIKSIEIYYDNRLLNLVGSIENAKFFNIKTGRKI